MKKQFAFCVMIFLTTSLWAQRFSAVAPSGQTLYFTINNVFNQEMYAIVVGQSDFSWEHQNESTYSNLVGNLVIPDSVTRNGNRYAVKRIGDRAFHRCQNMTSVVIPSTVFRIESNAFFECTSLTSVSIPSTLSILDDGAFEGCTQLTSITLPNSISKISSSLFRRCSSLQSIEIPNGVTRIEFNAFDMCSSLQSVAIHNVQYIGNYAFQNCTLLTNIQLGEAIDSIGEFAFSECSVMPTLTLPRSLQYIGQGAFSNTGIVSLTIEAESIATSEGWVRPFSVVDTLTIGRYVHNVPYLLFDDFAYANGLKSLNYNADSCVSLPSLDHCYTLTTLNIGSNVKYIPQGAFYGASYITSQLQLGDSIREIGELAFYGCSGIPILSVGSPVPPVIYSNTFSGISNSIQVIVPCGVQSIYEEAPFWNNFSNIVESDTCSLTLTAQSNDTLFGIVEGSGLYNRNILVTITAIPRFGCAFNGWSDGATYNPYTFVISNDTFLTAFFTTCDEVMPDTVVLHDTTIVTDTVTVTQFDTITNTVYDTIDNFIYDTLLLTDTVWLHDTIVIHDTVYITQEGINGVDVLNAKVYSSQGQIVVEGAEGNMVTLYDVNGRVLATKQDDFTPLCFDVPVSGTYMIKIGTYPARKVVVIR